MEDRGGEPWQDRPDTRAGGSLDVTVGELLSESWMAASNGDKEEVKNWQDWWHSQEQEVSESWRKKISGDSSEVLREGGDDLTLRAEESDSQKACTNVDHIHEKIGGGPRLVLWAMKAAKERRDEFYDSARKENILGRKQTRLELWKEHIKDPIIVLDKALKCVENQYQG